MLHKGHIFDLLRHPSAETYGALLRCVIEHPDFNVQSNALPELWRQLGVGDIEAARGDAGRLTQLWIHSPEYHMVLTAIARRDGDANSVELESWFTRCCVDGLLALGDGTEHRPYQVARVADEYSLMRCLESNPTRQTMKMRGDRVVDVFECSDGKALHFLLPRADPLTGKPY